MKHNTLPASHQQALLGEFMLTGEVPGRFSIVKAGRTIGRLMELGQDTTVGDLIKDNPGVTENDITRFWELYLHQLAQADELSEVSLGKAELFERYDSEFMPLIDHNRDTMQWLGAGSFSTVYKLTHKGGEYAVRFPYKAHLQEVNKHMEAALCVRDIANIEHVVAASFIDGITVSEFIPGQLLRQYEAITLHDISQEAFDELYASLLVAEGRGVGFDTIGSNLQYDPFEDVLTMLDVGVVDQWSPLYGSAAAAIFTNICNIYPDILDDEWGAQRKFEGTAQLHLLDCFRTTLEKLSSDSPLLVAINQRATYLERRIREYAAYSN